MKDAQIAMEKNGVKKQTVGEFMRKNYVVVAFIALLIFCSFASPVFLTVNNIMTMLLQNSTTALVAIGMLMVVITGGIDLSVGSFVAIAVCFVSGFIQDGLGVMSVVYVLLICIGFGCVTGVLVSFCKVAPFIATLSMMTILKGIAYIYQVGANRRIDGTFLPKFIQSSLFGVPIPVWILIVVFVVCAFVLNKTRYGRSLYAIGGNQETARLVGINVNRSLIITYAISGLLAGLAGIVLCGRMSMGTSQVGDGYEMDAIAAVVVGGATLAGGRGSIAKTLIGAFLIGVLMNIMNLMGIASYPQMVIKGIIIILAVLANRE